jgi:acetyltransferase-like isoleucine patch superfamily enzyme
MPRLALVRFLLAADTLPTLLADARLAALVKGGAGRARSFTLALPGDPAGAVEPLRRFVTDIAPAAGRVDVRAAAAPATTLLDTHDALLAAGAGAGALVVKAWQRGLCAVTSAEQAEAVAVFDDDYPGDDGAGGGGRWYSRMEGEPVVITHPERIVLGYGARINPRAVIHNEGVVEIGRGSLLGADAELNLFTARLTIGRFCHTSSYFAAVGSRHTLHLPSTFAVSRGPYAFLGEAADKIGDIVIGHDVWFGARVIVLPGVHVADGCVVGAGSVVTRSLEEPYGIYAGNPARLIRHRFAPPVIERLRRLQWWNWPTARLWQARAFFRTDLAALSLAQLHRLLDSLERAEGEGSL